MMPNSAPIVAARVLLRHGLDDDVVVRYVARTWALDARQCEAVLGAARFLTQREAAARSHVGLD